MRVLFNILWHFPGLGFLSAVLAYIFGLAFTATVVGTPIGLGLMQLGNYYFAPLTRRVVLREEVVGKYKSKGWRIWSNIVLVLYLPLGLVLFITSLLNIVLLIIVAIPTVVGIVFLFPHVYAIANSLTTILNPVGRKCVYYVVAEEMERLKAREELERAKSED